MATQIGTVPLELANEIKPEPHEDTFFDMFFEIYHPEENFYITLDAYCRVWSLKLEGSDISLLQMLWRTAENHRIKQQKEKIDKSKKQSSGSGGRSKPKHKKIKRGR